jgi:hypothetical protein
VPEPAVVRKLNDKALRRDNFNSVSRPCCLDQHALDAHNDAPKPFISTATTRLRPGEGFAAGKSH